MNIPIICLSLKYINNNYQNISNICKWIYHELVRYNYNDNKLLKSLDKKDYKIIKSIIKFNQYSLNNYLIKFCKENELKLVKLLIHNGADIHIRDDEALRYVCCRNCFDIVEFLINNGANIHVENDFILRCASFFGRYNLVKFLINNGADVHAKDNGALRIANCNQHFNVVKLLIDNGANKNFIN